MSLNWNESTWLVFFRAKRMKFITNKISAAGGTKKMFSRAMYPETRAREGFEEPGACLWFVPKAADSFLSCLTSKRSRRITRLNRNWIIRRDEINALPWHFRSGRDTRDWLVFRPYIYRVPPFVSLAAPSRKPFPATVIYRSPVIHRASSHRTRGWFRSEKAGKFAGHVDARVHDSRLINEEIRRRCRRDKNFIREKEVKIYVWCANLNAILTPFFNRKIEGRNLFDAIKHFAQFSSTIKMIKLIPEVWNLNDLFCAKICRKVNKNHATEKGHIVFNLTIRITIFIVSLIYVTLLQFL